MEEVQPYGYIYLTTNIINGKGYIGKHSVSYHDPNYIGSGGRHFWNAVNKYGRENFINEVLCWCFSEEELNEEERFLIEFFDCIDSDDFYNEREGGKGGWGKGIHHPNYGKISCRRGTKCSEETRSRISKSLKEYYKNLSDEDKLELSKKHKWSEERRFRQIQMFIGESNPFYGKTHSDEVKQKIRECQLGRKHSPRSQETRDKIRAIKLNQSDETRRKISEAKKGHKYPDRTFNRICNICGKNFISRSNRAKYCNRCNPKNKLEGGNYEH